MDATVNPKRLLGACREVSFWIAEHEIAELEAYLNKGIKASPKRGAPTQHEIWLTDALFKVRHALAKGERYPAMTEEEIAAA
jgi:hypothetical protein